MYEVVQNAPLFHPHIAWFPTILSEIVTSSKAEGVCNFLCDQLRMELSHTVGNDIYIFGGFLSIMWHRFGHFPWLPLQQGYPFSSLFANFGFKKNVFLTHFHLYYTIMVVYPIYEDRMKLSHLIVCIFFT